jgi:hypothetical protein
MPKRIYTIVLVLLTTGLLITGCDRSASISPMTTPTSEGDIPFPVATQSQLMKDILAQTQTAGVANSGTDSGIVTSTPAFTFYTDTPQGELPAVATIMATATPTLEQATVTAVPPTATPTAIVYPTITPGEPTQYASCASAPGYGSVPTVSILAVAKDVQVTISANNFPTNQSLNVRMGSYGTEAKNGTIIATPNSGSSGCFSATYLIPAALAGSQQIAIRVETATGYYGYNWFYNTSTN